MKSLILVISTMLLGCLLANAQGNILISQPKNGSRVPQSGNTIKVTVRDGIPSGKCLVVFIQDPTGQWWPYTNLSRVPDSNSGWQVKKVQFGDADDKDLVFNIQAIIIDDIARTQGILALGQTQIISNNLPLLMPIYDAIRKLYSNNFSGIVSVIRQ